MNQPRSCRARSFSTSTLSANPLRRMSSSTVVGRKRLASFGFSKVCARVGRDLYGLGFLQSYMACPDCSHLWHTRCGCEARRVTSLMRDGNMEGDD